MNKKELIAVVAEMTEKTKKETAAMVDACFEAITDALVKRQDVRISGFGTFTTVDRAEHVARNPQTGETFMTEAKVAPKMKFAKALKEAINA